MIETPDDAWMVVANVQGDRRFRNGAKLHLCTHTGGGDRAEFWGKSLGGRYIRKWTDIRKLSDIRVVWAPHAKRAHCAAYSDILHAGQAAATLRLCRDYAIERTPA